MTSHTDALSRHPRALRSVSAAALIALFAVAACDSTNPTATGTPTAMAIGMLGGSAQAATFGSSLPAPLIVHVTDQYGNGLPNASVTFTATGGAFVVISPVTTDSSGNASTLVVLGSSTGTDTVTASVAGAAVPVLFFETSLAGPPATIAILSGNGQSGVSGTVLVAPLVVQVMDAHGNPVVGDTVSWGANLGLVASPITVTASDGTASQLFTPALGTDSVTATVNGTALSKIFVITGN